MNQTQTESMRFALEALEGLINRTSAQAIYSFMETERRIAISACVGLRKALAEQPAQPATYTCGVCGVSMQMEQPAQRKPLTDEQLADFLGDEYHAMTAEEERYFRLAEAAHRIKEQP